MVTLANPYSVHSVIDRFIHNRFSTTTVSTIGSSFFSKQMQVGLGKAVRLDVWDTAGTGCCKGLVDSTLVACLTR